MVCVLCVFLCVLASVIMCLCVLFVIYCVMLYNSFWVVFVCACVRVCVLDLMCLWMLLVMYCVRLCGLSVAFAFCCVCGRVFCSNVFMCVIRL